jgi:LmbE family N-acetylglucosaminyl deacetylase
MATSNPYRGLVDGYARLLNEGKSLTADGLSYPEHAPAAPGAATVLIFSPHPDDEVIIGGLPLRLLRERGLNVINVVVTLGSRQDRRAERWQELRNACRYLGFGLLRAGAEGLERINPAAREQHPAEWSAAVAEIAEILRTQRPAVVFAPHASDWNPTHIGTHHLVLDALRRMSPEFACQLVETEFWGAMDTPNLLVESSPEEVADLVAALALHVGEVARNPYHLRLPAWMMDNVRRGAERVRGPGAGAPEAPFATLYRLQQWTEGRLQESLDSGSVLTCKADLSELFP